MITQRREMLDRFLEDSIPLMKGRVLDVGGKKVKKRGSFRPPLSQVDTWEYVNMDPETEPDYCCSAERLPVDDGSIDVVVMAEILEYLQNPTIVMSEVFRVLKAGGVCILTVPWLVAVHGDWQDDRQRYTEVKLRELFFDTGFSGIEISPMGGLGAVIHDLLHVAITYADCCQAGARVWTARVAKGLLSPWLRWLDRPLSGGSKFVHTGYAVVLKK